MKKILLSLLQISVTLGMLWWVFHDHDQRNKMLVALRTADYRWVGARIVAYLLGGIRRGRALADFAPRSENSPHFPACPDCF